MQNLNLKNFLETVGDDTDEVVIRTDSQLLPNTSYDFKAEFDEDKQCIVLRATERHP